MAGIIYYCLDLETNGLQWKDNYHEISELSIIRAEDRTQLSRFVKVDRPQNSSVDALRITGKTMDDLSKGISKRDLIEEVEKFVSEDGLTPEHRCLIGHNIINFDRRFLWQLWSNYSRTFPFSLYLDTMELTRSYAKKMGMIRPKVNLTASCDMLGVRKVAGAHDAVSDTRNTFLLWLKLKNNLDQISYIKKLGHGESGW